jgi:hypothetical protein
MTPIPRQSMSIQYTNQPLKYQNTTRCVQWSTEEKNTPNDFQASKYQGIRTTAQSLE